MTYGEKRTKIKWKKYTGQKSTKAEIAEWFEKIHNIAVVSGKVSGNLMVIDVDFPEIYKRTLHKYLKPYYKKTWVIETARGRQHIYFRIPFPTRTISTLYKKKFGIELRSESVCNILPPSLFKDGTYENNYKFVRPVDKIEIYALNLSEIRRLKKIGLDIEPLKKTGKAGKGEKHTIHLPQVTPAQNRRLSNSTKRPASISVESWDLLHLGLYEQYGYYPKGTGNPRTRSEADFNICLELITKNSYTFEEVYEIFETYASQRSKYLEKPEKARANYLYTTYQNASKFAESTRDRYQINFEKLYAIAGNLDWTAFAKSSKYSAMGAYHVLLKLAKRLGRLKNLGISRRTIANQSGFNTQAIQKAIEILISGKLISKNRGDTVRNADRFDLMNLETLPNVSDSSKANIFKEYGKYHDLDIFRQRGHGKTGLIVYLTIKHKMNIEKIGLEAPEIVRESGISQSAIYKKLSQMEKSGLLRRDGSRWLIKSSDFDGAAKNMKVHGIGEKQRKYHDRERRAYEEARISKSKLFYKMIMPKVKDLNDIRFDRIKSGLLSARLPVPLILDLPQQIIDILNSGDVEAAINEAGKIHWPWKKDMRYFYREYLQKKAPEQT